MQKQVPAEYFLLTFTLPAEFGLLARAHQAVWLLVVVDEFQVLLGGQDTIADRARAVAENLARMGPSAGIHLLFATQTLAGLTGLRALFSQFANRIAYKCDTADAAMLFGERNTEPRLLERQGEAIYNDRNGEPAFNRRYQTSFLADGQAPGSPAAGPSKESLSQALTAKAAAVERSRHEPVVFDGRRFPLVEQRLNALADSERPVLILGDSPALLKPVEVELTARNGNHMLLVGGTAHMRHALVQNMLSSFRFTRPFARIAVADFATDEPEVRPPSDRVVPSRRTFLFAAGSADLPGHLLTRFGALTAAIDAELVAPHLVVETLAGLVEEIDARAGRRGATHEPVLVVLHALETAAELRRDPNAAYARPRPDDPPDASSLVTKVLTDGAAVGVFLVVTAEDVGAVERVVDRRQLDGFGLRSVLTVTENDSRALLGDASGTQLQPGRGVLLVSQGNRRAPFRPYLPTGPRPLEAATAARRAAARSGD